MICPSCHAALEAGSSTCPSCGKQIWAPVAPSAATWPPPVPITEPVAVTEPVRANRPHEVKPHQVRPHEVRPTTSRPDAVTTRVPVTEQLPVVSHEGPAWQVDIQLPPRSPGDTAQLPVTPAPEATVDDSPPGRRTAIAILVLGVVAAGVAIAGAVTDVGTVRVTGPELPDITWTIDDMASNLLVAAGIAAALVLVGSTLALLPRRGIARLAVGLAGGAGLALAGVAAHVLGQSIAAFDDVKTLLVHSGQSYTLRTTMEVGFWLVGAAGVLGVVLFVLSLVALRGSPTVGSRGAMIAVAVVGALASISAAMGPTIPLHGASFVEQFANDGTPPFTSIMRAGVLVLVLVGAVTGFVVRRPWGLTMAFGSVSVALWLTVSTLLELGDRPIGLAGGNPDTLPVRIPQPHLATSVGLAVVVLALLVGYTASLARRTAAAATR